MIVHVAQTEAREKREKLRAELETRAAVKIQSIWRAKRARRRYLEQKAAAALYRVRLFAVLCI